MACNSKPQRLAAKRAFVNIKRKMRQTEIGGTEAEKKWQAYCRTHPSSYWFEFKSYWENWKGFLRMEKRGEKSPSDISHIRKRGLPPIQFNPDGTRKFG